MVRMFVTILAFLALGSPAFAGEPKCDDCELVQRGVHRQVIPTPDVVCVFFVQPQKGNVLLRLNLKDGTSRPYTKKNANTVDRICVGRHWLRELTESMYICDDFNHAVYPYEDVQMVGAKPKMSREGGACLLGKEKCVSLGFKVGPPR